MGILGRTTSCFRPNTGKQEFADGCSVVFDFYDKAAKLASSWNVSEAAAQSWCRGDVAITEAVEEQFRQHSLKQSQSDTSSQSSHWDGDCSRQNSTDNVKLDSDLDTRDVLTTEQHDDWQQRQQSEDVIGSSYQQEMQAEDLMNTGKWMRRDVCINPHDIFFCSRANGKLLRIGKGSFGSVYKGLLDGEMVAVKVCNQQTVTERGKMQFRQEVSVLQSCVHPNVVQLKGACSWKGGKRTVLVTEFMDRGDLCSAIARRPETCKWSRLGKRMALDIAQGLAFLHGRNIVHFDLKSGNVLLNKENTAKIADVGLAKTLTDAHGCNLVTFLATVDMGTFAWAAPEALLGNACNAKADIYSYGVVLWELCTGEVPQGRNLRPIRIPEEAPEDVADLVTRCLEYEPAARPSAQEICQILEKLQ